MIRLSIPTTVSLFRLLCFAICFGLLITAIPIGARRMQGPPIPTDLPNLDECKLAVKVRDFDSERLISISTGKLSMTKW
ncbi:MAG: hypothetical protein L0220_28275, partial [Acidobacteria bacterium]|nr:hypothetical protein [Acidobacteriota bacterium]